MPRKKRKNEEHRIQAGAFDWKELAKKQIHDLWTMHAIPNGGRRDSVTGAILKREGVTPGIPDIHLPVARGGYFSLYIEVKTPAGTLSKAQKEIIPLLKAQNNKVVVCRSTQEIIDTVIEYLQEERTQCLPISND